MYEVEAENVNTDTELSEIDMSSRKRRNTEVGTESIDADVELSEKDMLSRKCRKMWSVLPNNAKFEIPHASDGTVDENLADYNSESIENNCDSSDESGWEGSDFYSSQ